MFSYFFFFLPGSGLVEHTPILLLRLWRFLQMSLDSFLKKLLCWRHAVIERWMQKRKVFSRLMESNSDHSQNTDWRGIWIDIHVELKQRDDGETTAQATHLGSHPLSSASDAAGLLRLYRLPLGQVVGGVLLVLCVVGQGGFLHRPADKCEQVTRNKCQHVHRYSYTFFLSALWQMQNTCRTLTDVEKKIFGALNLY